MSSAGHSGSSVDVPEDGTDREFHTEGEYDYEDLLPAADAIPGPPPQHSVSGLSTEIGKQATESRKRSRMSSRDVQLGQVVADGRIEVAIKSAELREATALKVSEISVARQKEVAFLTNVVTE
jgi:hypothetical protein